jgi:hypothetical protein
MNAALLEKSPRLQRVLALLQRGGRFTTRDIIEQAQVCAVNSSIAELRSNGYQIRCERRGDVWTYELEETSCTDSKITS